MRALVRLSWDFASATSFDFDKFDGLPYPLYYPRSAVLSIVVSVLALHLLSLLASSLYGQSLKCQLWPPTISFKASRPHAFDVTFPLISVALAVWHELIVAVPPLRRVVRCVPIWSPSIKLFLSRTNPAPVSSHYTPEALTPSTQLDHHASPAKPS